LAGNLGEIIFISSLLFTERYFARRGDRPVARTI
jgi:hypothetical protein